MTATSAVANTAQSLPSCACGCEFSVRSPKARFLPGHDARMVSEMIAATIDGRDHLGALARTGVDPKDDIQNRINAFGDVIDEMFSKSLSDKYVAAAHNAWDKALKPARAPRVAKTKVAAPAIAETGTVKVGRWTYPARVLDDGNATTQRNEKRDGSGEWVEVVASTTLGTFVAK